jgi:uncharacterized protein YndB with AHSA1/START domain
MSVMKEASGRRSVQVEVEVPGTPEEVWQAIASGPGISSWFVPTEFEERDGVPVSVVSHFGPGMDAVATVTAWDPPRRFAAEGEWGPGAPPIATEWIVESRSGGMCVVRVVHSLFASTDDWDDQLTGTESGWPGFFRILRLYLSHFRGQRGSVFQLMSMVPGPESEAWDALTGSLGLAGATIGERRSTPAGAPALAGTVEPGGEGRQLLLRLDEPAPGIAHLIAHNMGGQVVLAINFYLFGDDAPAVAAREEPLWRAWMDERFPSTGDAGAIAC